MTEFERQTTEALGSLTQGMGELQRQVGGIFTTLQGNGHAGLVERMALAERVISDQKEGKAAVSVWAVALVSSLVSGGAVTLAARFLK